MVNQNNGIFSKLTGLTFTLFKLNIENINEEIDENISPLEKAVLFGSSNLKCRKIIFMKDLMKLLNNINYENFKKYIYPLIVKLSDDNNIEIKNEICNKIGDLCAYLLQNNNDSDGCEDIIKLIFPILDKFIKSYDNKSIIGNVMKSLLILSTHINSKYRKNIIFPFILSLITNEEYKAIGFILLIKICHIFERDIIFSFLIPYTEYFFKKKDEEIKIYTSSYFYNICKMLKEEDLSRIFLIFKNMCNDENDIIKIINIYNCAHISSLYSKTLFFNFFVPLFNNFLRNGNLYIFYYSLINLLFFICIFEDINLIHPFYVHKIIFFFNNVFSSHLFTLNYLNETAKKKNNYFFLNITKDENTYIEGAETNEGIEKDIVAPIEDVNQEGFEVDKNNIDRTTISESLIGLANLVSKPSREFHPSFRSIKEDIAYTKEDKEGLIVDELINMNIMRIEKEVRSSSCSTTTNENHSVVPQKGEKRCSSINDNLLEREDIIIEGDLLIKRNYEINNLHEHLQDENKSEEANVKLNGKITTQSNGLNHDMITCNSSIKEERSKSSGEIATEENALIYPSKSEGEGVAVVTSEGCFEIKEGDVKVMDRVEIMKKAKGETYVKGEENEKEKDVHYSSSSGNEPNSSSSILIEGAGDICIEHNEYNIINGYYEKPQEVLEEKDINNNGIIKINEKVEEGGTLLIPSSSALLETSYSTSMLPSISASSNGMLSSSSIFFNNNLINDLIINNTHFCVSISQFFQIHGNDDRYGRIDNYHSVKRVETEEEEQKEEKKGVDGKNVGYMEGESRRNEFVHLNENDLTDIDNTFNHDKTIDINLIKGCYYNELELIKSSMIYGKIFLKKKKEENKNKKGNNDPINYDNNDDDNDIYNIGAIDFDSIKKKFFFDTPNNIIVSHNINAVYISALHIPMLILIFREYFFRFFSHVFFFICTYPYYFIRKIIASLFYDILHNLFDAKFLKINVEKLNKEQEKLNNLIRKEDNRMRRGKNTSSLHLSHSIKAENKKYRNDFKNVQRNEYTEIMHTFNNDYATYYSMKRIQNIKLVEDELNNECKENAYTDNIRGDKVVVRLRSASTNVKSRSNRLTERKKEKNNCNDTYKQEKETSKRGKKESIEIVREIKRKDIGKDNRENNEKDSKENNGEDSKENNEEDNREDNREDNGKDNGEDSGEDNGEDNREDNREDNGKDNGEDSGEDNGEDNREDNREDNWTDKRNINSEKNGTNQNKEKTDKFENSESYNKIIKRIQKQINANLYESDFFINEENENFFFYKKFLNKYENVYIKFIEKFKKYYTNDSLLFFFHFFIYYFLRDSNVLVKKAILKNYDKIISFFPCSIQKILMSYLFHVLEFKTLNYSLRRKVSKIIFRIVSKTDDARLCKDEVAAIRLYTSSYFYLFLIKGCPRLYNFFKGNGELLPVEEYKKDIVVTNENNYKLQSRSFTGGDEVSLIKTVIITFAKSNHFYDRQIFINMCDKIIHECPKNLFLLYFLKPFVILSDDKIKVVRITWETCVLSQFKKKRQLSNVSNVFEKLNEVYEKYGKAAVSKCNLADLSSSNNASIKTFDLHDLDD
ncbi:conserved Plasmodium protein, unknown function [Plasmodium malariae]|uniref:Uncharacterized protein n=1 Tax=Plasmodium malariae TaxID=5858 RepID=A0A1D3RJ55_PLAMA|nr:conserved Plasmodium protein, unknown function [Plasmodium malariae]SCN45209.1 conserved Plasmodium protein, unknown function [Plasmodium malariae]